MYGLPDSMVVGMVKRGKRLTISVEKNPMRQAEKDLATAEAVVMAPFVVAGGILGGIEKFANFVGKRAERADRKMRASRARKKLKAGKL